MDIIPYNTLPGAKIRKRTEGYYAEKIPYNNMLDEPTNNLDLPSCEVLEQALEEFEGTVLVISHDRYFLNRIADRIVELEDGALMDYAGDYTYYTQRKGIVAD